MKKLILLIDDSVDVLTHKDQYHKSEDLNKFIDIWNELPKSANFETEIANNYKCLFIHSSISGLGPFLNKMRKTNIPINHIGGGKDDIDHKYINRKTFFENLPLVIHDISQKDFEYLERYELDYELLFWGYDKLINQKNNLFEKLRIEIDKFPSNSLIELNKNALSLLEEFLVINGFTKERIDHALSYSKWTKEILLASLKNQLANNPIESTSEKPFVIGVVDVANKLNYELINIPQNISGQNFDSHIHDFIINIFSQYEIKKLIIPLNWGNEYQNYWGIDFCLHIRLTSGLGENRFIPIIVLSDQPYDEISQITPNASILVSNGIKLIGFKNYEEISKTSNELCRTSEGEFSELFKKNIINIKKPPTVGNHSLANEWGLWRLGRLADYPDLANSITKNSKSDGLKSLYFKSLTSNLKDVELSLPDSSSITSDFHKYDGKKFFLIDDKSSSGWFEVIEYILHKLNPTFSLTDIEISTEFPKLIEQIDIKIQENDFDLIFLDFRLYEQEDDDKHNAAKIAEFSGAILLQHLKSNYPAIPVILFTASNKVWNIESLLDLGADGFYIKESPEIPFSNEFSHQNFEKLIAQLKDLIPLSNTLKWYWSTSVVLKSKLNSTIKHPNIQQRIKDKLDMAFGFLSSKQTKFQSRFLLPNYEMAFLTYWSCLNEFDVEWFISTNEYKDLKLKDGGIIVENGMTTFEKKRGNSSKIFKERYPNSMYYELVELNLEQPKLKIERKVAENISFRIPVYLIKNGKSDLKETITTLNTIRNHLDFTHAYPDAIKNYPLRRTINLGQREKDTMLLFEFLFDLLTNEKICKKKAFQYRYSPFSP